MATNLPHSTITPIGQDRPAAIPSLWNSRYTEIDENFERLAAFEASGTCYTGGETAEKAVTCENFALSEGALCTVKFSVSNSATDVTLNINQTGAVPIFYKGAAISPEKIVAGCLFSFRYDGKNWDVIGNIDDNELISDDEIDALF